MTKSWATSYSTTSSFSSFGKGSPKAIFNALNPGFGGLKTARAIHTKEVSGMGIDERGRHQTSR